MTANIEHHVPSLNASLTGDLEEGVACFRGIPYATLEKRWTHSRTKHSLESPFDATKYGPRCPQGEGQVLVTGGVNDPVPGDDEFNCLNLNVAVPQEALNAGSALPVMVWIHGYVFTLLSSAFALSLLTPQQWSLQLRGQLSRTIPPCPTVSPWEIPRKPHNHCPNPISTWSPRLCSV